MRKKIFAGIFGTAVCVLVLSLVLVLGTVYVYYSDQYEAQLRTEAAYLSAGIEDGGADYLKRTASVNEQDHNRITWIDASGDVLYDNQSDASKMGNHKNRSEVRDALQYGSGSSTRYSDTLSTQTHYYAQRLDDGTVVRIAVDQHSWLANVLGSMKAILAVILAAAALSVFIAYRLTVRITRPLNDLNWDRADDAETQDSVYEELQPLLARLTAQKRQITEQMGEIRRQQSDFAKITDNMEEGLIVLDAAGTILSCNSSALEILGVSGGAEGKNILQLTRERTIRETVDDSASGKSSSRLMKIGDRLYSVIGTPVTDGDNGMETEPADEKTAGNPEIRGTVIVMIDTTEREERDRLRREFTANVTHELKTPLTSVMGFAEIMKSGLARPEDTQKIAGKIYDEAERLLHMIDDIIHLSRLDESGMSEMKETTDLAEIGRNVAERLAPAAKRADVTISCEGKSAKVRTVPRIADEMVYNLAENAIKYNRPSGSVTITTGSDENGAFVRVADTGIGISETDQKRVFERFYRVDKSHSSRVEGTGLGLAIVRHGAEVTGAKIDLQSAPGKGSVFTVTFPS